MDSNEYNEPTSSNNWKTVNDLFEQLFGPDSNLSNKTNAPERTTFSSTSTHDFKPSYTMLNNHDPAQHLQEGTKISYLTYEDTIDEFHMLNSEGRHALSTRSSETSYNGERYQAVSQPFHIPHHELLKTGDNIIRAMIFNHNTYIMKNLIKVQVFPLSFRRTICYK